MTAQTPPTAQLLPVKLAVRDRLPFRGFPQVRK